MEIDRDILRPALEAAATVQGTLHDDYKRLELQPGEVPLSRCPVCGSEAELWQYSTSETTPVSRTVMCSNGEPFGPQDGIIGEGCLLYMPPELFYRATAREAIRYWNEYAKALTEQRAERDMEATR